MISIQKLLILKVWNLLLFNIGNKKIKIKNNSNIINPLNLLLIDRRIE